MWQNVGYTFIGAGVLVLIGWAVKGFFVADDIPLLLRIAVKDRLTKKDEFKEVEH